MFFWYVSDQALNEFHGRNRFFYVLFVFMPVVMEGNHFTIVFIDAGSGNDRTSKITPNVFHNGFGIAEIRFCINIKSVIVIIV